MERQHPLWVRMSELKLTPTELAVKAGIQRPQLYRYCQGKQMGFRDGGDERLEDVLGVPRGTIRYEWARKKTGRRRGKPS